MHVQRSLIKDSHPDVQAVRDIYNAICDLAQLPVGSEPEGPLAIDRKDLMRLTEHSSHTVSVALELLERQEILHCLPVRQGRTLVRFMQTAGQVQRYVAHVSNRRLARFVEKLQRILPNEAYEMWWDVDISRLARQLELSRGRIMRGLVFLKERGLLDWHASDASMQVWLDGPRVRRPAVDHAAVRKAERRAVRRLEYITRYAGISTCRRQYLLSYFGEVCDASCGACDVCRGRHRPVVVTPEDEHLLRQILSQVDRGAASDRWFDEPVPAQRVRALVDFLLREDYLQVEAPLEGRFSLTEKAHQWQLAALDQ